MSWPWGELGLGGPASLEEVRQAYAHRLKQTHPEEDPEGFQRLHAAYQEARRLARQAQGKGRQPLEPPAPAPRPGPIAAGWGGAAAGKGSWAAAAVPV